MSRAKEILNTISEAEGGYEVAGVMGMKSKPFKKSFKTAKEREKWIDKNSDDIGEVVTRDPS